METTNLQAEFMKAIRRFNRAKLRDAFGGLYPGEFFTLELLRCYHQANPSVKGMYVSELATALGVSAPAASRMLRSLEDRELIERTVDRDNRRNTHIRLTEAGRRAHQAGHTHMRQFTAQIFQEMGEENIRILLPLVNRLGDIMEKISKNEIDERDQ